MEKSCRWKKPGSRSGTVAFVFGDSVYEVFRMYQGRCWLETEHLARLKRSLAELDFAAHDLDRLMTRGTQDDRGQRNQGGHALHPDHPRRGTAVSSVPASPCFAHRGDHRPAL